MKPITPPIAMSGIIGFPAINLMKCPKGVLLYPAWTFFCLFRISTEPNTTDAIKAESINISTPGKFAIGPASSRSISRSRLGLTTCRILKQSRKVTNGTSGKRIDHGRISRKRLELFSKNLLNRPDTPPRIGK